MRSFMSRHPVASFLALFYGLGWAAFIPSLLGNQGFGILKTDIPLDPFRLLSIVFFALVPFVVTRIVDGPGSARRLFGQVRHVRVGPQWYLVAFFGPPAALFVVAILLKGIAPIEGLAANIASIPTVFLLGVFVLALLGNLWEETSWSGFVTARLQARYGPLRASLIVRPLFGLYHLPLVLHHRRPERQPRPPADRAASALRDVPPDRLLGTHADPAHVDLQLDGSQHPGHCAVPRVDQRNRWRGHPRHVLRRRRRCAPLRGPRRLRPRRHRRDAWAPWVAPNRWDRGTTIEPARAGRGPSIA